MNAFLLAALMAVESGGNPFAVGDGGKAVGCLQIHAAVVADVNRIAGRQTAPYTLADRLEVEKSKQMCVIYLAYYATEQRIGRPVTDEDRARIWNGGPSGWKKPATEAYWAKVKRALAAQKQTRPRVYVR
jgi:hypothetical protein